MTSADDTTTQEILDDQEELDTANEQELDAVDSDTQAQEYHIIQQHDGQDGQDGHDALQLEETPSPQPDPQQQMVLKDTAAAASDAILFSQEQDKLRLNPIRHVASSNRLSRTPKRESSLHFPLPAVLPALPPLIPVSKVASPTTSSGSMPATPSTPVSASGRLNSHSLSSYATHDSRSVPETESRSVSSGRPADSNPTDTRKVPTGELNTEPVASQGPGLAPGLGLGPVPISLSTVSDKDTPDTNVNGNNVDTREADESSVWPEHPRQFLERVKETVSKAELGTLLSKGSDPFHQAVLRIHMESFDFRRDPIDLALRYVHIV
ncbi:hypothetical protein EC991_003092 [Linnemannia zychae]|nr:hypothetical protein EC991_003092 [Linnemannia zychae]